MSLLDTASLIVTPNGYKEGKLYSVIPSDGSGDLSVTRATTATRVNSAGLVELVPYNLLSYSEQFDNAAWNKIDIQTVTTGITDPNGGTTGVRIIPFVGFNGIVTQSFSTSVGSTYTLTFWMKGNANGVLNVNYGGAVLSPQNNVSYTTQWQQFQYSFTADSTTGSILFGGFFTWASGQQLDFTFAQLVEGSVAKDYQKTETRLNIPRLDYSNGTCPSILVEPQRTNLLTYSSSFDNAAWIKNETSVTSNATISPSGVQDADKIIPSTNNSSHNVDRFGLTVSNNGFASVYAKAAEFSRISLYSYFTNSYTTFDLSNGTILAQVSSVANIEDAGNGWYRCSIYDSGNSMYGYVIAVLNNSNTNPFTAYTGDGTSGVFLWGAQLEVGSYATSYIPTTSASVTRNADTIFKTGATSLIGQTEGTIFVDVDIQNPASIFSNWHILMIGSQAERITIYTNGSTNIATDAVSVTGGFSPITGSFTLGRNKIAVAYKANDVAFYVNGNLIGTRTTASIPLSMAQIDLGGNYTYGGYIAANQYNAAALWKTRLTNTQLAQLTTI